MDYKSLLKVIFVFFTLSVISSCGSYQYTSFMNDGIYEDDSNITQSNTYDIEENNDEETSEYYSSYFNDIAKRYSTLEDNDELFTDVENYRSSENDSISKTYGPWGDYRNSLTINVNSYHNDGFWSRWRYPSWMWNYGYGYGNVWGYGFNNFWSRPYPFYGGFYDPYNPFWGYYSSFYYGYGYGYGYPYGYYSWWRPYGYWNNYYSYGRNLNTNVSFVSGRRGSRNALLSRSNNLSNSNIRDRFNRSNSNILSDRLSRIDRINNSARVNPNMYNKPLDSSGSSNNLSRPSVNGNNYNSKPSNNNYTKPSRNYSRPNNNGYRPSNSNYTRPSSGFSPSSGSSFSRGSGGISSGSSSSRGGKSGR